MNKEYIDSLKEKRDKRGQELKNITLDINAKLQELEAMKINRERLIGVIAVYNEEIDELDKGGLRLIDNGKEEVEKTDEPNE